MPACAARADRLPEPVQAALAAGKIPDSAVAAVVLDADGRERLAVNADQAMSPASVMKLITSFAALRLLGPAYTWRTDVYAMGEIANGTLRGDLLLKGYGDPRLSAERVSGLARELMRKGIRHIAGDVVIDQSQFALPPEDPAAFDGDPLRPYNAIPAALTVERNLMRLYLTPAPDGLVAVKLDPPTPGVRINSTAVTQPGPCDSKDTIRLSLRREREVRVLDVAGILPAACGERIQYLNVLPASQTAIAWFRQLWSELGGTIAGGGREARAPDGAVPLLSLESPALAEVLRDIDKWSSNIGARQVFLSLVPAPATPEAAAERVRGWLTSVGVATDPFVIENGSGLSRRERVSARGLARVLHAASRDPLFSEFESALPVVAIDGTMKQRFATSALAARAHLKSGSLVDVKAIAGYAPDGCGRRLSVVFLLNHPNAGAAEPALEAFLQWLHAGALPCLPAAKSARETADLPSPAPGWERPPKRETEVSPEVRIRGKVRSR